MDDHSDSMPGVLAPGMSMQIGPEDRLEATPASPDGLPAYIRISSSAGIQRFEIDVADGRRMIRTAHGPATLTCEGPGPVRLRRVTPLVAAMSDLRGRVVTLGAGGTRSIATAAKLLARGHLSEIMRRVRRQPGRDRPSGATVPDDLPVRRRPMRPRPRLAIVGPAPVAGGAQFCQFELAVGLRTNHHVDPIVFLPGEGPLMSLYAAAGIECRPSGLPVERALDEQDLSRCIADLAHRLRDVDADIVLANTLSAFHAIEAGRRAGLACILNPRESERDFFSDRSADVEARALGAFAMADRVVFVAEATRQAWAEFDGGHFSVVPDALGPAAVVPGRVPREDARRKLGVAGNERLVVCVGTVTARKGQVDLVRAYARLDASIAGRLQVAFVGDRGGDYSKRCSAEAAALPAESQARIRFVPETVEVADWYAAADVFVLCSRHESYPRVILEAMSHGLAIVSTPVYGVREQLRDGLDGCFYEPGDFRKLAEILARLATDDALAAQLSAAARRRLSDLQGYDSMIEGYSREIGLALTSSGIAGPASR